MGITIQEAVEAMKISDKEAEQSEANLRGIQRVVDVTEKIVAQVSKGNPTLALLQAIRSAAQVKFDGVIGDELSECVGLIESDVLTDELIVTGFSASRIDPSGLAQQGWKIEIRLEPNRNPQTRLRVVK